MSRPFPTSHGRRGSTAAPRLPAGTASPVVPEIFMRAGDILGVHGDPVECVLHVRTDCQVPQAPSLMIDRYRAWLSLACALVTTNSTLIAMKGRTSSPIHYLP